MGWMVYLILVTQRLTPKIWDPYTILDISRVWCSLLYSRFPLLTGSQSATEKAIKKQYRKLTLLYHPDKVKLNEATNQTMDEATAIYVEISKAYKALTDEEVRNNYIQYGHPYGKQSFSIGIALPKLIITDGAGKYVLLIYGLLLGVLLPYVVGKWWYGTQRMTKEKVLVASAGNLFREWEDGMTKGGVISTLTSGEEYKGVLKGNKAESGLGKVEQAILAEEEGSSRTTVVSTKDAEKLKDQDGVRRKALALLWAYLGRVKLGDVTLDDGLSQILEYRSSANFIAEKYEVAPLALALNDAFVSICLAYGPVLPLLSSLQVSQNIIQAILPDASPLLQLPHITPAIAAAIEGIDSRNHFTVQQFMEMPEYQRRKLATDQPGVLTPKQYNEAVSVARQLPLIKVEKAFFKCRGEKFIVTGSLVQFVIKCRVIPPGTANVPEVTPTDLEDLDPEDDDVGATPKTKAGKRSGIQKLDATEIEREIAPPLAYAPYFARDHSPRWQLFLSENKQNRVAVPPSTFSTFDKPIFDDSGRPTFNIQTMKLQFQAPPMTGQYTFVVHLVCDSYIGMDTKMEATLVVEDSEKAVDIESEEEISEPDEGKISSVSNHSMAMLIIYRLVSRTDECPENRRAQWRYLCTQEKEEGCCRRERRRE